MSSVRKWAASLSAFMLVCLLALTLAGCGNNDAAEEEAPNDAATETVVDENADRTFVDDAGREVTVPGVGVLEKIYFTSPNAQIYCFTLAPEMAAGSTMNFTEEELAYLPEGTADLPFLGTTSGGQELNPEAIMAEGVQLIFDITSFEPGEGDASSADDLQAMTNIPVVVLDGSFAKSAECYEKLGELLGKEAEAAKLADYTAKTLADVEAAVAQVPEDERVSVYYAEGPDGLSTEPSTSPHAEVFNLAGAVNVAADVEVQKGKGMSPVSLEQILAWNPDVIIAWDSSRFEGGADDIIRTDPNWATIKAVEDGKVYSMPQSPFSWVDRPRAVNRIIGLEWLTNLLYPEYYDIDITANTIEFFDLFYHVDIDEDDVKTILKETYPEK